MEHRSLPIRALDPPPDGSRGPRARRVFLAPPIRRELQEMARSSTAPHRVVQRAQIILLAAKGWGNMAVARRLGCGERTVRKWRARFAADPLVRSLQDRPRSGRPSQVPVSVRCEVIKLACSRPDENPKAPFRQIWTLDSLKEAVKEESSWQLSRSEIWRILQSEEIRPHRFRMWLHSPDPAFQLKVKRICDLYHKPPKGATVLCIDEKSGMQALERKHPTQWPTRRRFGRYEFEYIRHGTRVLIAAFDVGTGEVFGQCRQRRTANDLLDFMEVVAQRYPEGPVYVVWDNLNIHYGERWKSFNRRHNQRFKFVYTPLHASWINQIEVWFALLQRRILKYSSLQSPEVLEERVLDFIEHWNRREAHPFAWTFRGTRKRWATLRAA